MADADRHHILVRDFTTKQKEQVEATADKLGVSTSRFCRDAAVKEAGGKVEDKPRRRGRPTVQVQITAVQKTRKGK